MAANPIPQSFGELLHLSSECQDGATALGASIPLVLNTSALIGSERAAVVQTHSAYQASLGALRPAYGALSTAMANGVHFGLGARDVLKNYLGKKWSAAWREAGFVLPSLAVPQTEAGLGALLEQLYLYFGNHAAHENATLQVTAARANTLWTALKAARNDVNAKGQTRDERRQGRDAVVAVLRGRLRGLIHELQQKIGRDDLRWRRFGLNVPAAPITPGMPINVQAEPAGPGSLLVWCDQVPYADHYRFFTQRPNVDVEPVFVGRANDCLLEISGLTPGAIYKLYVTAANEKAESRFSEPITMEAPAQAMAA